MLAAMALPPRDAGKHIDRDWFRRTLVSEAAHWREAAVTPNGFFQASLDRQWRPAQQQTGTLVTQTRLMFVMAAGYEVTRERAYLENLRKGADFLLASFRDREYGGWYWSVAPDGSVLDDSKDTYGHAFVLFGLSHAARLTRDQRYRQAALQTWEEMKSHLRYDSGFFKPRTTRDFKEVRGQNTQNPMMHLFEALLALYDATGSRAVLRDAEAHAEAIFTRLFRAKEGYLPEFYEADWTPARERNAHIEMGHQFEWAFLLSQGVDRGLPRRYLAIGQRLIDYGMKAYDAEAGGIFSRAGYSGEVRRGPKGWWEQCEFLRALMRYAARHNRSDLWPAFDKSLAFVRREFIDPEYAGWYPSYDPAVPAQKRDRTKGNTWRAGYHVIGMYSEALRY